MSAESINHIRVDLEKAVDKKSTESEILDMLKLLPNSGITKDILKRTKIGLVLTKVKKAFPNSKIFDTADSLVNLYKKEVKDEVIKKIEASSSSKSASASKVATTGQPNFGADHGTKYGTIKTYSELASPPTRNKHGEFCFDDYPDFRPNLSPKEVLQLGSFGGTYFRPIYSSITGKSYKSEVYKELPQDWLEGLNIPSQVSSSTYRNSINKYNAKCGQGLDEWETSGWITGIDPYGWFQWYCRFFQGRRSNDDDRQLKRGLACMGPKGRWRSNLMGKICDSAHKPRRTLETELENFDISPVVRQVLQHWAYKPTLRDLQAYQKRTGR